MFGNLAHIIPPTPSSQSDGPPKQVPPPTPIHFPQCRPRPAELDSARSGPGADPGAVSGAAPPTTTTTTTTTTPKNPHLTTLLQALVRPADQVQVSHLEALGVVVVPDAPLSEVIPRPSPDDGPAAADWSLPPFAQWDELSREETLEHARDSQPSRPRLCNGKPAPGPTKYVDLRQGLLTENQSAFRAVRRVPPRPGEQYVRLGYCHEFFRNLEALTSFWDDTSIKPASSSSSPPPPPSLPPVPSSSSSNLNKDVDQSTTTQEDEGAGKPGNDGHIPLYRISAGTAMPAPFRTQLLTSFLKLVTYDFNCNIMSRQEPRLYITSPPAPAPATPHAASPSPSPHNPRRRSHFSSGCNFLYRMPLDRDSAKRGIIEGPIAAVSPRHTTAFPPLAGEREAVIDLAREVIAALITAQHRARAGRVEARIGQDAWWTTRPRWGGGAGGPIGKEAELMEAKEVGAVVVGDKDERPLKEGAVVEGDGSLSSSPSASASASMSARPYASRPPSIGSRSRFNRPTPPFFSSSSSPSSPLPSSSPTNPRDGTPTPESVGGSGRQHQHQQYGPAATAPPPPKRPRTGLAIYDAYRMVRPPSLQWDPKTRYEAIGRQRGADHDDVFVVSSLFHHVAILRVRVPDRLLAVLDGAPEEEEEANHDDDSTCSSGGGGGGGGRKRKRKLEVYRTRWYDFFVAQDRVEAMQAVWAMMAYAMRDTTDSSTPPPATTTAGGGGASGGSATAEPGVGSQQGQKMDIDSEQIGSSSSA